jgi:hypothetical protein
MKSDTKFAKLWATAKQIERLKAKYTASLTSNIPGIMARWRTFPIPLRPIPCEVRFPRSLRVSTRYAAFEGHIVDLALHSEWRPQCWQMPDWPA